MNYIIYDLDSMENARKAITDLSTELTETNNKLDTALKDVEADWQTEAGKKFFTEHKNDWSTYVVKYTQKLDGLERMLSTAKTEYEKIDNKVDGLAL